MGKLLVVAVLVLMVGSVAYCDGGPTPLGVTSRSIGGGRLNEYTPGVANGVGLNNIGLLVRMWGKVTYKNEAQSYFYIDDGCGLEDGSGQKGVRVSYDNIATSEQPFNPPARIGDYVAVTGISSTIVINNKVRPNLLPRRNSDMVTLSPGP
jgi:hypothetical protein